MTRALHVLLCVFGWHCLHRIPTHWRDGTIHVRHDGSTFTRWRQLHGCCRCPRRTYRLETEAA